MNRNLKALVVVLLLVGVCMWSGCGRVKIFVPIPISKKGKEKKEKVETPEMREARLSRERLRELPPIEELMKRREGKGLEQETAPEETPSKDVIETKDPAVTSGLTVPELRYENGEPVQLPTLDEIEINNEYLQGDKPRTFDGYILDFSGNTTHSIYTIQI